MVKILKVSWLSRRFLWLKTVSRESPTVCPQWRMSSSCSWAVCVNSSSQGLPAEIRPLLSPKRIVSGRFSLSSCHETVRTISPFDYMIEIQNNHRFPEGLVLKARQRSRNRSDQAYTTRKTDAERYVTIPWRGLAGIQPGFLRTCVPRLSNPASQSWS